jgi:hypothetical protein
LAGCGISTPRPLSLTRSTIRAHLRAIIRVFDESGAVIETHESAGDFREP